MNGKGDKPRPIKVDRPTFEDNWDRIFGKKPAPTQSSAEIKKPSEEGKRGERD